ncbi:MAG: hypothetical protein ACI4HI_09740, partial [Lachnospiraceae bacterium]
MAKQISAWGISLRTFPRFGQVQNTGRHLTEWLDRNDRKFATGSPAMLYFCCFLEVGQPAHPVRPAKNQNRILFRADRMHRLFNGQKTAKASQNCPSEL